jgi:hypothetical protein
MSYSYWTGEHVRRMTSGSMTLVSNSVSICPLIRVCSAHTMQLKEQRVDSEADRKKW